MYSAWGGCPLARVAQENAALAAKAREVNVQTLLGAAVAAADFRLIQMDDCRALAASAVVCHRDRLVANAALQVCPVVACGVDVGFPFPPGLVAAACRDGRHAVVLLSCGVLFHPLFHRCFYPML